MNKRAEKPQISFYDISVYKNEIYGVSILWIMLFHGIDIVGLNYSKSFEFLSPVQSLLSYGNMGVEIFLLCSGICLYFSFLKNNDTFSFLKKRLIRLLLPVFVIESGYWIYLCFIEEDGGGLARFLEKITLMDFWLTGDQQIWFVPLILLCYFIYPYIYSAFFSESRKNAGGGARCLLLIGMVVSLTVILMLTHRDVYDRIEIAITRIPIFIIGCYLGKTVYEKKNISKQTAILIFVVDLLTFVILEQGVLHGIFKRYFYLVGGVSLTFTIAIVLKFLNLEFINKFLAFFGKISLNLYLSHIMVIRLYKLTPLYDHKRILHYIAILIISVAVAYIAEKIIVLIRNVNVRKDMKLNKDD